MVAVRVHRWWRMMVLGLMLLTQGWWQGMTVQLITGVGKGIADLVLTKKWITVAVVVIAAVIVITTIYIVPIIVVVMVNRWAIVVVRHCHSNSGSGRFHDGILYGIYLCSCHSRRHSFILHLFQVQIRCCSRCRCRWGYSQCCRLGGTQRRWWRCFGLLATLLDVINGTVIVATQQQRTFAEHFIVDRQSGMRFVFTGRRFVCVPRAPLFWGGFRFGRK